MVLQPDTAALTLGSNYLTVESSGSYTIQNYEGRPAGVKALNVRRGTGNEAGLWIESRQNTGLYSSALNSSLFNGALIHYQDSGTRTYRNLLDFTTGTSSFSDAALPVGEELTPLGLRDEELREHRTKLGASIANWGKKFRSSW